MTSVIHLPARMLRSAAGRTGTFVSGSLSCGRIRSTLGQGYDLRLAAPDYVWRLSWSPRHYTRCATTAAQWAKIGVGKAYDPSVATHELQGIS